MDFFLQHWNVVGRITGRALGPALFQFSFESEKDLQTILSKAPFHFKRWMMVLQRWEPVVSDTFPAFIPFWINIHGIPLHYWTEDTINAIGKALGPIETKEVDKARLRVSVNALKPLIMRVDIELPSKAVVEVELEYENLQKHCFFCKSLTHEEGDCNFRPPARYPSDGRRDLGISQLNTLEIIEDGKRRQEDRRLARQHQASQRSGARWTNYKLAEDRAPRSYSREVASRAGSERSSGFEENRRRFDDRTYLRRRSPSPSRQISPRRSAQNHDLPRHSESGSRPPDPVVRTPRGSLSKEANSKSYQSPPGNSGGGQRKSPLASRLSDPRTREGTSEERTSAKERLSVHTRRTSRSMQEVSSSSQSKHLQDVEVRYLEDTPIPEAAGILNHPSSSNVFASGRLGPCERSPIRTLSEDRIHVSLRLGPLISESESGEQDEDSQQTDLPLLSKAAGKRVMDKPHSRKKTGLNPTSGIIVKRRRVTKTHSSPRRKLLMDAIGTGGRSKTGSARNTSTIPKLIPAMVKKGKDFQPLPKPLP